MTEPKPTPESEPLLFTEQWKIANENDETTLFFPTKEDTVEYRRQLIIHYENLSRIELARKISLIGQPERATAYDNDMRRFEPVRNLNATKSSPFVKCLSGLKQFGLHQEQEVTIEGQPLSYGDTLRVMFATTFGSDPMDNRWNQWFIVNAVLESGDASRYKISLLQTKYGPRNVIPIEGAFWFALGSHILDERGYYKKEEVNAT